MAERGNNISTGKALFAVLIVPLGGMLFSWACSNLNKLIAKVCAEASHFASHDLTYPALFLSFILVASIAYMFLLGSGFARKFRWAILSVWSILYIGITAFGSIVHPISLPLFIFSWLLAGGIVGLWVASSGTSITATKAKALRPAIQLAPVTTYSAPRADGRPSTGRTTQQRMPQYRPGTRLSRAARTSGKASPYGRIPIDTYQLLQSHIRDVSGPILSYLPLGITKAMRDWTIKKTLDVVLRDWRDNENLDKLEADDISDLGSFAEFSYELAVGRTLQELGPIENAIYKAALNALLEDWLNNWNAGGKSGPPVRPGKAINPQQNSSDNPRRQ